MSKSRQSAPAASKKSILNSGAAALLALLVASSLAIPSASAKGPKAAAEKAETNESSSWTTYKQELESLVVSKWFPPTGQEVYKPVVVQFRIRNDGKLSKTDITKACGIPDVDKAARQAVITAAPFKPFPADANKRDFAKFEITFDKAKLDRKHSVMKEF